jgi:ADP-ribose pyrophosphatase
MAGVNSPFYIKSSIIAGVIKVTFKKSACLRCVVTLPPTAKRVFKGLIFDVYQYPQEMYDGTTHTFERVVRTPTVDVIAVVGDRLIAFDQEQPGRAKYPSLVGGHLEDGEEPLACAKRELLEESGYASERWELFCESWGQSKMVYHQWVYIARDCRKVAEQSLDNGERITLRLVSFDDFLQLCRIPTFAVPLDLKFAMYEALLEPRKKESLRQRIFG